MPKQTTADQVIKSATKEELIAVIEEMFLWSTDKRHTFAHKILNERTGHCLDKMEAISAKQKNVKPVGSREWWALNKQYDRAYAKFRKTDKLRDPLYNSLKKGK